MSLISYIHIYLYHFTLFVVTSPSFFNFVHHEARSTTLELYNLI